MNLPDNLPERIAEFSSLINQGITSWTKAGELLVELENQMGEDALMAVTTRCPGLSYDALQLFLRIGRREIHPMLTLNTSVANEYIAALPYEQQEMILKEGAVLLEEDGERTIVPADTLTSRQCEQLFDNNTLRTIRQQRLWLDAQEKERVERKLRLQAAVKSRAGVRNIIDTGSRKGYEPDDRLPVVKSVVSLDELKDATPQQLFKLTLDQAHVALMDARRHLSHIAKPGNPQDDLITIALNAVGKLRYAANNPD